MEPKVEEGEGGIEAETQNEPTVGVVSAVPVPGCAEAQSGCSVTHSVAETPRLGAGLMSPPSPQLGAGLMTPPSLAPPLGAAPDSPAADPEAHISPWIREYYTDERLAEMMAWYRARSAEDVARQRRDDGDLDEPDEWSADDADPPWGPDPTLPAR
jgi:hypothetical protein